MDNNKVQKVLDRIVSLKDVNIYPIISPEVEKRLHELLVAYKPKVVVEIGSCVGYSALFMAQYMIEWGGHVYTIEHSKDRYAELLQNITDAGMEGDISTYFGKALDIIPTLKLDIDCLFIDAMKKEYLAYITAIEPLLRVGTLVLADNVTSHEEKVKNFLDYMTSSPHFNTEIFPEGGGILVSKRI